MAQARRIKVFSILAMCVPGLSPAQPATLSILECSEMQTCDTHGNCVQSNTRVALADYRGSEMSGPYLNIGPLVEEVGGGMFFEREWTWVLGEIPDPSSERGRDNLLSLDSDDFTLAHVFRPGREVRGLASSDWVRADYSFKQVMF